MSVDTLVRTVEPMTAAAYTTLEKTLLQLHASNEPLKWSVTVYEERDEDTPVGIALVALEPLMFAAAASEFVYSYGLHLVGASDVLPYGRRVFEEFETDLLPRAPRSWSQVSLQDGAFLRDGFTRLFGKIDRGHIPAASDILRLELMSFQKVNPGKFRGRSAGRAALFSIVILANPSVQPSDEGPQHQPTIACMTENQHVTMLDNQRAAISEEIKREGHTSPENKQLAEAADAKLDAAMKSANAACGHDVDEKRKGGHDISFFFDLKNAALAGLVFADGLKKPVETETKTPQATRPQKSISTAKKRRRQTGK
jgi:hypothetical protein